MIRHDQRMKLAARFGNFVCKGAGLGLGAFLAACSGTGSELEVVAETREALECGSIVLTPPPDVTAQACGERRTITVGQATANGCDQSFPVRGQLIASNGTGVTPVDVVNGTLSLIAGRHVVRWTVVGDDTVAPVFQVVVVNPGLHMGNGVTIGDRASVGIITGGESGPAHLISLQHGDVIFGHDSVAGSVTSVGAITIRDRARLLGNVTSGLTVTVAPSASVAGTITQLVSVNVPSLLPSLPSFPPATGGSVIVNSGMLRNLSPGSYGSLAVNSGGVLFMGTGDYFFQNFNVNSNTVVVVAAPPSGSSSGTSGTRIFVSGQFSLQTQFLNPGGSGLAITLVGHSGSGNVTLNQNFLGTFVAPNAELTLGTGGPKQYIGAFYARALRVSNDTQLLCNPLSAVGGQL